MGKQRTQEATAEQPQETTSQQPKKKKWVPAPNPHDLENIKGEGEQRVHLLLSKIKDPNVKGREKQAWVIRFAVPPNQMPGFSKENPHPVLKMLKEEGHNWNYDENDGKGGHGKIAGVTMYGKVVKGDP